MSKSYRLMPMLLQITDYLALVTAEWLAIALRNVLVLGWDKWGLGAKALHITNLEFWLVFPCVYIIVFHVEHLYSRRAQFWQLMQAGFRACVYATFSVVLLLYATKMAADTSRLFVFLYGVLAFGFVSIFRFVVKKFLEHVGIMQIPILIIGAGKVATRLVNGITNDAGMGYKIIGFLEDKPEGKPLLEKYPLLGGFADAERVIQETGVNYVTITATKMHRDEMNGLVYRIQPLVKHLTVVPNVIGIPMCGLQVESLFNERLMVLKTKNNLSNRFNRAFKMVFDYVLTIVGLIPACFILGLVALKVRKDSPGPIMYNGERIGEDGKLFKCYKFRSMYVNSDEILEKYLAENPEEREKWNKYHKLDNDPRVTPFGALMRKTSIDELPQIFNVLRGEMSLVGPRPYLPREQDEMGNYLNIITSVRPGITGMWQVSGRSEIDFNTRMEMDCWYICNWSVWMDIMLLWKTVKVVLCGKGAY